MRVDSCGYTFDYKKVEILDRGRAENNMGVFGILKTPENCQKLGTQFSQQPTNMAKSI